VPTQQLFSKLVGVYKAAKGDEVDEAIAKIVNNAKV
jgi:hypothetical protein